MRRLLVFALLALVTAAGIRAVALEGAEATERFVRMRAHAALAATGAEWPRITVDGLRIRLTGEAPDPAALEEVRGALGQAALLARVDDRASVAPPAPPRRGAVRLELLRAPGEVTLAGRLPDAATRADLLIALGNVLPDIEVEDLTGLDAAAPPPDWGPELGVAVEAVRTLASAYVLVQPGRVTVEATARDAAERDAIVRSLGAVAGPALDLDAVIRTPRRVLAPFVLAAESGPDGRIALPVCAARDAEEAAAILAAFHALGGSDTSTSCPDGLGGPGIDWDRAAIAGLETLATLPGARLELRGATARLSARGRVDRNAFERARDRLASALPEGVRLEARLEEDAAELSAARASGDLWLALEAGPAGLTLEGRVAGEPERTALETLAALELGGGTLGARLATGAPDDGAAAFQASALALIETVAPFGGGAASFRAELTDAGVALTGRLEDPETAGAVHRRLVRALGEGLPVRSALVVDLPAAVAQVPLTPERCVAQLNEAVDADPVVFDPGSTELGEAAEGTVERLALLLARCKATRIEVAGHTDDQGGAEMNLELSRARADAVRRALLDRLGAGASVGLEAKGYGEEHPVADNATEEGRALNRRIAFALASG